MKNIFKITLILSLLIATQNIFSYSRKNPEKVGILLVSFGSSYPETRATFQKIEDQIQKSFPNVEIKWAYTSNFIRNKLRKKGINVNSPTQALAQMVEEHFTKVAVQSLHVIPGEEYESLLKTVELFRQIPKTIKNIELGKPLLFSHEDSKTLINALVSNLPSSIKKNDAVIFMGHGSSHPANIYYPAMQYYLWRKNPLYFIATVEGVPTLDNVFKYLEQNNCKTVYLHPFMTIAGNHIKNDMAGNEADSWKSILEAKGYKVICILKGMAQYQSVINIWCEHLKVPFKKLNIKSTSPLR